MGPMSELTSSHGAAASAAPVDPASAPSAGLSAVAAYPRVKARTLRFTCGAPRSARAVGDGSRALFLRSDGPEDLANGLWLSWFDASGDHHETRTP